VIKNKKEKPPIDRGLLFFMVRPKAESRMQNAKHGASHYKKSVPDNRDAFFMARLKNEKLKPMS
jgi:hypothetical protein